MVDKVRRLRAHLDDVNPGAVIQVDGGINEETIGRIVAAGATSVVAGTAVLNDERTIGENVALLREAIRA
jgi:ribulose-phosphate 3-epimerase